MFWKIAHFLANRWDQFHMFLWDQIHINRVGPGTFLLVDVVNCKKGTSIKIVRQGACEIDSPFFVQKLIHRP